MTEVLALRLPPKCMLHAHVFRFALPNIQLHCRYTGFRSYFGKFNMYIQGKMLRSKKKKEEEENKHGKRA